MDFLFPLRKLHGNIYDYFFYKKERKPLLDHFKKEFKKNINTVFLFMSPNYGNIGDHAIAYAEILFLEELGFNVIEITCDEVFDLIRFNLFKYINGHNIIITGGGFLGTLWFGSEKIVREIIKRTPKSKIVLMPNTIFYESSDWGIKEKIESTVLYNKHKHLYLYAREKESYHLMKSLFKNVELCPDMALFLNASKSNTRKGCLVRIRRYPE